MRIIDKQQNMLLFSLLGKSLFGANSTADLGGADLGALFEEAKRQTVAPQVFQSLPTDLMVTRPDVYTKWMSYTMQAITMNARNAYAHRQLADLLEAAKIPYCILKGAVSASYYSDPGSRVMGDVDFIIYPSDVERAVAALEAAGYVASPDAHDHSFHIAFNKESMLFELHYQFSESENPAKADHALTTSLLERAVDMELPDGQGAIRAACPAHHGLIMLLHMKRHMTSSGMGLRHLCDWAVFVNSFSSDVFETEFRPLFEEYGVWRFAQVLSQVCHRYLGCPAVAWCGTAEDDLCADLMEYIVSTGNFGNKGTDFANLFTRNTDAASANRFVQFVLSIKRIVISHWPKAAKNPLLLAVGFMYFPARYMVNSLLGRRRKVHFARMLKRGRTANNTFSRLGFYKNNGEKKDEL